MKRTIQSIATEKKKQSKSKAREAKLTRQVAKKLPAAAKTKGGPKTQQRRKQRTRAVKKAAQKLGRRLNLREGK